MRTIYILLISIIVIYLIYQVCQKYITQENFDPSLVPVSSIISLANMAQKLVTGSGTFTFPNNFSIGSTTAPHNLIVTSYASIGGNTSIGGNMIVGDNTNITGNSTIKQSVTVPKIVGNVVNSKKSLTINSNLLLNINDNSSLIVTSNFNTPRTTNINNGLHVFKNFENNNNTSTSTNLTSKGNVNVTGNIYINYLAASECTFNKVTATNLNTIFNLNLTVPTLFKYFIRNNTDDLLKIRYENESDEPKSGDYIFGEYKSDDTIIRKWFDSTGYSYYNIPTPPPPPITTPPTPQAVNGFKFVNLSVPSITAAPVVAAIYTNRALAVSSIETFTLNANRISVQNGSDGGYNTLSIVSTAANKAEIHCDNLTIADASYGSNAKVNINGALTVTGAVTVTNLKTTTKTDNSIYDILPVGSIMMWWNTKNLALPTNWNLCDGNGGRPSMSGSYIVGGNGSGYGQSNTSLTDLINGGNIFCGTNVGDSYQNVMVVNFIIRTS